MTIEMRKGRIAILEEDLEILEERKIELEKQIKAKQNKVEKEKELMERGE